VCGMAHLIQKWNLLQQQTWQTKKFIYVWGEMISEEKVTWQSNNNVQNRFKFHHNYNRTTDTITMPNICKVYFAQILTLRVETLALRWEAKQNWGNIYEISEKQLIKNKKKEN